MIGSLLWLLAGFVIGHAVRRFQQYRVRRKYASGFVIREVPNERPGMDDLGFRTFMIEDGPDWWYGRPDRHRPFPTLILQPVVEHIEQEALRKARGGQLSHGVGH